MLMIGGYKKLITAILAVSLANGCSICEANDLEMLVFSQRQPGKSQVTNQSINYSSKSFEFLLEPDQSRDFPVFQWMFGAGSGSRESSEFDQGPNYNTRLVIQPSGYLTAGIRLMTHGQFSFGFGVDVRFRNDGMRGSSGDVRKKQGDVDGALLLIGKAHIPLSTPALKIVVGAHFARLRPDFPYPDREFALFSGVRF